MPGGLLETGAQAPGKKGGPKKPPRPRIHIPADDHSVLDCAAEVAEALQGKHVLFRRGEVVVYPSPTGEPKLLPMESLVFRSFIEEYIEFFKTKYDKHNDDYFDVVRSLNSTDCETILASRVFWSTLPEIRRVHPCPLPALRPDNVFLMLPLGFDAETGIYTFVG